MSCYSPCGASRARARSSAARDGTTSRPSDSVAQRADAANARDETNANSRRAMDAETNKITTTTKTPTRRRDAAAPRVARVRSKSSVERRASSVASRRIKRARRRRRATPPRPRAHASKIFFAAKNVMKNSGTSASVRSPVAPSRSLRRVPRRVPANVLHASDRPHAEQDRRRPRVRQSARRPHRDHRRVVLQRVLVSALHAVELFLLFVSRRGVQVGVLTPCAFRARATRTAP